jgi:2-keto-3-deoxy-6-phosphogluconate aldolase
MPAGSIILENMQAYYDEGAFAGVAGVTTELKLLNEVREGSFAEITACARRWVSQVSAMTSKAVQS